MVDIDRANSRDRDGMVRFGDFPEAPGALLGDMAIGFLADILADAGRAFNGDIRAAALFVLLVRATRSHGPVTNGSHAPGLSQSQLAAISGIPRETVRRKLSAMERQGWVQRHGTMWSLDCDTAQPDTALRMMILEERLRARVARFLDEAAAHWG